MKHLAFVLVVAALLVAGCGSSSSSKHHIVLTNDLSYEIVVFWALAPDDTVDTRQAFADQPNAHSDGLMAGETKTVSLGPPGHYRWYYDITTPYSFRHAPAVFDIVDGNSDILLNAGGTSTGRPLTGVDDASGDGGTGDGGAGNTDGGASPTCIPSGHACDPNADDHCCTVCGLNQTGICG